MHITEILMLYSCPFREISMSDNFFYYFAHVGEMFILAEGIIVEYLTRYVTQTLMLMTNADLNTSLKEACLL